MKSLDTFKTRRGNWFIVENFEAKSGEKVTIDETEYVIKGIERHQSPSEQSIIAILV